MSQYYTYPPVFSSVQREQAVNVIEKYDLQVFASSSGAGSNVNSVVEIDVSDAYPYNLVFPIATSSRLTSSTPLTQGFKIFYTVRWLQKNFMVSLPIWRNSGQSEQGLGTVSGLTTGTAVPANYTLNWACGNSTLYKNNINVLLNTIFPNSVKYQYINWTIPQAGQSATDVIVGTHYATPLDKIKVVMQGNVISATTNLDFLCGVKVIQSYEPFV